MCFLHHMSWLSITFFKLIKTDKRTYRQRWHLGSDHRLAIANLWVRQTNRRTYLRQTYKKDNIPSSKKRRQCEPEQEGAVKTYGGEEGKINSIFTIDKLTCYIVDNLN